MIGPSMGPEANGPKRKKSKTEREAELRAAERDVRGTSGSGVNYSLVADRHVDDSRYEREVKADPTARIGGGPSTDCGPRSAAFDAFMRMQTGQSERTIGDKINDQNRPTWEQYKKDNEDRLHLEGADSKKMIAYRKELDAERQAKLAERSKTHASLRDNSDSDGSDSDDDSKDKKKKRKKEKKKKLKKEMKKKARKILRKEKSEKKKRKRGGSSSSDSS